MSVGAIILINLVSSIAGSMLSLAIWFHYDLEGWWEHRRHARAIEHGRRLDKGGTLPGEPDEDY